MQLIAALDIITQGHVHPAYVFLLGEVVVGWLPFVVARRSDADLRLVSLPPLPHELDHRARHVVQGLDANFIHLQAVIVPGASKIPGAVYVRRARGFLVGCGLGWPPVPSQLRGRPAGEASAHVVRRGALECRRVLEDLHPVALEQIVPAPQDEGVGHGGLQRVEHAAPSRVVAVHRAVDGQPPRRRRCEIFVGQRLVNAVEGIGHGAQDGLGSRV